MTVQNTLICYSGVGMVRSHPLQFDQLGFILDQLKRGSSCLVDLRGLSPERAQRAVDILAGACHMLKGHSDLLSEGLFLFSFPAAFSQRVA